MNDIFNGISDEAKRDIKFLDLARNDLVTLPVLQPLLNLEGIDLSSNKLRTARSFNIL